MGCKHFNFKAGVRVNRICAEENGPVAHYTADVEISCHDCGMPFKVLSKKLKKGVQWDEPTISLDGLELRVPLHPNDGSIPMPPKVKGYEVKG